MGPALLALLLLSSSASGQTLPPTELAGGRAVSAPAARPASVQQPLLASNRDGFLAVWADGRYGQQDTVGAFFDRDGQPTGAGPQPMLANWMEDRPAFVVPTGDDYALFVASSAGSFAGRFRSDGSVELARLLDLIYPTSGAWTGSRFAIIAGRQLRFLDRDFNSIASSDVTLPGETAVAAAEGRVLLLMETTTGPLFGLTRTLHAQLIDESGAPLTTPVELASRSDTSKYGERFGAAASWNGSRFVVVWTNPDSVAGAALSLDGEVGGRFTLPSRPWFTTAEIAWDGRTHLVVWQDAEPRSVSAATVTSTGDVLATFAIPTAGPQSSYPAVAANHDRFLVVADDLRLTVQPALPDRIATLGPFVEEHQPQSEPVITAGASQLLVAWIERTQGYGGIGQSGVFVSRLAPNGMRLDSSIQLGQSASSSYALRVASAGETHLVTWIDQPLPAGAAVVRGALVRSDGSHQQLALPVAGAASNGRSFALIWTDPPSSSTEKALMFAEVSTEGTIGPTRTLAVTAVAVISLNWTGRTYAVHWRDEVAEHLMSVSSEGVVESDVVLPKLAVIASSADERGLVVVHWTRQPDGTALIVTTRFGFDGSRAPHGEPVLLPLVNGSASPTATLVKMPSGFTLAVTYQIEGPKPWDTRFYRLDTEGRIVDEFARTTDLRIISGVHAFGTTWLTHLSRWKPVPHIHASFIWRAFYRMLTPRIRAVRW